MKNKLHVHEDQLSIISDESNRNEAWCYIYRRVREEDNAFAAELVRRWNCHEELLTGCQKFVRWVDACWGASEILHTDTLKEYQDAKEAIKEATNE